MSETAEAPTSASIEDRMASFFAGTSKPAEPTAAPSTPEAQPEPPVQSEQAPDVEAADDDVTPDDVPADDEDLESQTSGADEIELTYNGQTLKVSRDEAKNLAQLGYHLRQRQDQIASELQQSEHAAQQLRQIVQYQEQVSPELRNADLEAAALARQLQGIDQNALARLAADDPAQYVQVRAQIDRLQADFQQALAKRNDAHQRFTQAQQQAQQVMLQQEAALLQRISPVFRDQAKATQARDAIQAALKSARPQTVEAVSNNAELMALAYKAARYDQLQASKRDKLMTASKAPAVVKPGTSQPANAGKVEQMQKLRTQLKKTGSVDAFAEALLAKGFK